MSELTVTLNNLNFFTSLFFSKKQQITFRQTQEAIYGLNVTVYHNSLLVYLQP